MQPNISADDVARFDRLAARWWDERGPMRPLHQMNPLRVGFVTARVGSGAPVLDVGCGAGLAAEALARAGHPVLGIDQAPAALEAARAHAASAGVAVEYRHADPATLRAEALHFPVITAFEVIEHVPDPARFIADLAALLSPRGVLFVSTLNRTRRSFLVAKLGAEYLLRLLPVGTHDWRRFITPAELAAMARDAGLRPTESAGMAYDPLGGRWRLGRDLSVNYLMAFSAG